METLTRMREQMKLRQTEYAEKLVELTGIISENDHKVFTIRQQVELLTNTHLANGGSLTGSTAGDPNGTLSWHSMNLQRDSEIKNIKDMIMDERNKREQSL